MKKKFLILLLILLSVCGCKANYSLTIDTTNIKEEIRIYSDDKNEYENTTYRGYTLEENFKAFSEFDQSAFINITGEDVSSPVEQDSNDMGLPTYKNSYISSNNTSGVLMQYTFAQNEYINSYAVNTSARTFAVDIEDDEISLSLGDPYIFTSYKPLEELTVRITISDEYEVTSHNAEGVTGNQYVWVVTRENYIDANLNITLKEKTDSNEEPTETPNDETLPSEDSTIENPEDDNSSISPTIVIAIISIIVIILLMVALILKHKKNSLNKL